MNERERQEGRGEQPIAVPSFWRLERCTIHEDYDACCLRCQEEVLTTKLEKAYKAGYVAALARTPAEGAAQDMREQFELWIRGREPLTPLERTSKSGAYTANWVNTAWLAWKAGTESLNSRREPVGAGRYPGEDYFRKHNKSIAAADQFHEDVEFIHACHIEGGLEAACRQVFERREKEAFERGIASLHKEEIRALAAPPATQAQKGEGKS